MSHALSKSSDVEWSSKMRVGSFQTRRWRSSHASQCLPCLEKQPRSICLVLRQLRELSFNEVSGLGTSAIDANHDALWTGAQIAGLRLEGILLKHSQMPACGIFHAGSKIVYGPVSKNWNQAKSDLMVAGCPSRENWSLSDCERQPSCGTPPVICAGA